MVILDMFKDARCDKEDLSRLCQHHVLLVQLDSIFNSLNSIG